MQPPKLNAAQTPEVLVPADINQSFDTQGVELQSDEEEHCFPASGAGSVQ